MVKLYSELILDHFKNPRNIGSLDHTKENVGTGLVGAPMCGDLMKLQIEFTPDDYVKDVKIKVFGCPSAIASSSFSSEEIKGKHMDEIAKIKNTDIAKRLSLPPIKLHCSMLAEDAIKAAIRDYQNKKHIAGGIDSGKNELEEETAVA